MNNDKIISEETEIANAFKEFFNNAVKSLNLDCDDSLLSNTSDLSNPVDIAIEKFKNHPSIITIKNNINSSPFEFSNTETDIILKELNMLDSSKNGTHGDIPAKCLKNVSNECSEYLVRVWNEEIVALSTFPGDLKLADVTPVLKKKDSALAKNYRPVSVLPTVSKIFERLMQKQILTYIDEFLSPHLCGYRKGYSTQTALISLLESGDIF